jgi:PadR family transcriptional regulator PadR
MDRDPGSLYPAPYRLEAKGWIDASWELSEKGKRARFYCLTRLGRKQLATVRSRWEAISRAIGLILDPAPEEGK